MLGLTAIEHIVNPETTLDKVGFLFNHVLSHTHRTSACVSGGALIALILLRYLKRHFHYIRRLPEVFVVVAISTCMFNGISRISRFPDRVCNKLSRRS